MTERRTRKRSINSLQNKENQYDERSRLPDDTSKAVIERIAQQ
jgi:hypothetical protein